MIICPVCEHQQAQGDECDNCGKKLQVPKVAAAVAVPTLPELEQTHHAGGRVAVDAPTLPELAHTRQEAGPDLPPQVVPDMETTRTAPIDKVAVEAVPELDTGRAADDGVRTAAPSGAAVCRYCRNVQAEGMVCDRCGMRLPRVKPAAGAAPAGAKGAANAEDVTWLPCQKCRTPTRPNKICTVCGTRVVAVQA
ncbi:class I tRNA ligase family protein [Hyalangium gracile]|uniref:class I tRNA ligase family protein n=1 Tax=Hyalangium gracile TaxID=394092 RepID=UPI001CCEE0AE|nr:class I tRNA ligase family protein [Hyalangium gracile]